MKRVVYSVASSLDGYIAGPKGEFDWIPMDPDIDFAAMLLRFDTLVMGRKTYDVTRAQPDAPAMPGVKTYVFSRTLRGEDCPGVTVSADPVGTVRALKAEAGKDIWVFGGGELFRVLLEAGLVDVVEVGLVPVLVGGGLPMLALPAPRTRLKLVKHRRYEKSGIVLLEYDVVRA
jgi:dihydrofolate reductase